MMQQPPTSQYTQQQPPQQQQQWPGMVPQQQQQQQQPPAAAAAAYQYQAAAAAAAQQQMYYQQQQQAAPVAGSGYGGVSSGGDGEVKTLWIGNLMYWMDESYIASCFNQNGEVSNVKLIRNKVTQQPEGYGFIEFITNAAAERALQSRNGIQMPNAEQTYRLNWASPGGGEKRSDGTPEFTIFVGDLAPDVTDSMLQETFKPHYTSVKSAKVVTDRLTGRPKGYGFVSFGDEGEQLRAMNEMNGQYCSSRPMRIGPAANKKNTVSIQNTQGTQNEDDPNNTTIFVGGLNESISDDLLRQTFSPYGQLIHVKIPAGKRCGFVQFADRHSAEEAIRCLSGTQLGGQTIRLSWGRSPSNKQPQADASQWNNNAYSYGGYPQAAYGQYAYGAAAQDPNMYYGGYPGYANYQQAPPQQ